MFVFGNKWTTGTFENFISSNVNSMMSPILFLVKREKWWEMDVRYQQSYFNTGNIGTLSTSMNFCFTSWRCLFTVRTILRFRWFNMSRRRYRHIFHDWRFGKSIGCMGLIMLIESRRWITIKSIESSYFLRFLFTRESVCLFTRMYNIYVDNELTHDQVNYLHWHDNHNECIGQYHQFLHDIIWEFLQW